MARLSATARIQFHAGFTLADAARAVPYLARLGISHLYASPLFTAVKGSTHGYDVVDPTEINPELGGRTALLDLVQALRGHDMGLILDIVPNHMASKAPENPWFTDVLQNGRASTYAEYFDIDWDSEQPELNDKMLLPILAEPYAQTLESDNLKVHYERSSGCFTLLYFDRHIPLAPLSLPFVLHQGGIDDADASTDDLSPAVSAAIGAAFDTSRQNGRETMHQLLEMQHYRLAFWQNAADEINWRRFFEISDLIGVRVERTEVFEATHRLIFELYKDGLIDGVRVDHIDGLAAPRQYCQRLRQRLGELHQQRPQHLRQEPPYVWLEKILAEDEQLDSSWNSDGTTGYEFMNDALRALTAPEGEVPLTQFWVTASNDEAAFDTYETRAREQILGEHLAGEFERLCARLTDLSNMRIETRDVTGVVIRRVMFALLVQFRVYRVYVQPGEASLADRTILERAAGRARESLRPADHPALDVLMSWLYGEYEDERQQRLLRLVLARFEQLSAPLAAKSVEDTAFYRYGRLLALNEVGGTPTRFHYSATDFHQRMQQRALTYPSAMSPLATHDHKRGADARARIAVLSERPDVLATLIRHVVMRLEALTSDAPVRISPVDLLMLLQTVVGAWPLTLDVEDEVGATAYRERLKAWQQKALREAKLMSNWLLPNQEYEAAADAVLGLMFTDDGLRRPIYEAVQQIAPAGAVNSLAQVLLQCCAPGVPDIYQGTERWDFSLVDPDNRRDVDFSANAADLDIDQSADELLVHWRDGRVKQWLVARLLAWRRANVDLCQHGSYVGLAEEDAAAARPLGFLRTCGDESVIVLIARHVAQYTDASKLLASGGAYTNGTLTVAPDLKATMLLDVITGASFDTGMPIQFSALFARFPVALLTVVR